MTARHRTQTEPLPPVAAHVDSSMVEIAGSFDWLRAVSPRASQALWENFRDSGYTKAPQFTYPDPGVDIDAAREALHALPVREIELPVYKALLAEKQRELDRQLELIELRGSGGFLQVSIDLFGVADAELYAKAKNILDAVSADTGMVGGYVSADRVAEAAQAQFSFYHKQCPDFSPQVKYSDQIIAGLMVSDGNLLISESVRIPRDRLDALLHHEIGTHILTWYNGGQQPLRQLQSGLAHYDGLQEGLGVLAEYLSGNLSAMRMRTLAGRVVAVRMMADGAAFREVFDVLRSRYRFSPRFAFTMTTRVFRGGGLTKDVVYLRGLHDLLAYLREEQPFECLFLGKFSLSQMGAVRELRDAGRLQPPKLLPAYIHNAAAQQRLADCGRLPVEELYQRLVA